MRYANPARESVSETVSVLLPCPTYDVYPPSQEQEDENIYGASFHDAVQAVLKTLCDRHGGRHAAYDELHELVSDTLDTNISQSATDADQMRLWQERKQMADDFVRGVITAADMFLARYIPNLRSMGKLNSVKQFTRLGEDTYRIDFTRTVTQHYDVNGESIAPCVSELNDLDNQPGFDLVRNTRSMQVTLTPGVRRL